MTTRTLQRRNFLATGAAALLTLTGFSASAWAGPETDRLLADILVGVTDAITRNYISSHYREGRWDGHYWWYNGRRYTTDQYREHLRGRAKPSGGTPAPQHGPGNNAGAPKNQGGNAPKNNPGNAPKNNAGPGQGGQRPQQGGGQQPRGGEGPGRR